MANITYIIHTNEMLLGNDVIGLGYSGNNFAGNDRDNPKSIAIKGHGPLPIGLYYVGASEDNPRTGLFSLPLTPYATNEMFGRGDFLIHGDNRAGNFSASDGCIILPKEVREAIAAAAANVCGFTLEVVA